MIPQWLAVVLVVLGAVVAVATPWLSKLRWRSAAYILTSELRRPSRPAGDMLREFHAESECTWCGVVRTAWTLFLEPLPDDPRHHETALLCDGCASGVKVDRAPE